MADALMLKYAISEVGENKAKPLTDQAKPIILTINIGPQSEILGYVTWMMQEMARHCRCRIRPYTSYTSEGWNAKIYGFESDVRYFELMYTTTRLHMLGVLLPRVSKAESLEDNAYRLHNSGYNWLQIAEMYGWERYRGAMYFGEHNGTRPPADMKVPYWHVEHGWQPATQVGSRIKRAYHRACAARGESVQKIAANGSATYRKSAADGYVGMIIRRLAMMRRERTAGAEMVLASRGDALDSLFRTDNPDLFAEPEEEESNAKPRRRARVHHMTINPDAYRRGAAHAQSADLSGSARMGGERGAIGS